MFKFGKSKTSFNVYNANKGKYERKHSKGAEEYGAYRTNRDEFFMYTTNSESQRKSAPTTSGPPIPPSTPAEPSRPIRQVKSTSDLIKEQNLPPNIRGAQSGVSLDPRGSQTEDRNSRAQAVEPTKNKKQLDAEKRVEKQRLKEQQKLEKQRLVEQKRLEKQQLEEAKKREKLAQQERMKQEKLRKEREKKEAQLAKKNKKGQAPQAPLANPLAQARNQQGTSTQNQSSNMQYSTNTLDSSISKTSGPPPYTDDSVQPSDSNVSFSKPVDTGSWDMVNQHRNNVINRPMNKGPAPKPKVTTMDLNYTLGEDNKQVNSEA